MKFWKSIPLHHKILAALVLGAVFGALFNVSRYELEVTTRQERTTESVVVKNWKAIDFFRAETVKVASFGPDDQLNILRFFKSMPPKERRLLTMRATSSRRAARRRSTSTSPWMTPVRGCTRWGSPSCSSTHPGA